MDENNIPVAHVRAHIRALLAVGFSSNSIGLRAGITGSRVRKIASGEQKRVRQETANRVLGIPLDEPIVGCPVPRQMVSPLLEEMSREGFSRTWVYDRAGISGWKACPSDRPRITWESYIRIRTVFRLLAAEGWVNASLLEVHL